MAVVVVIKDLKEGKYRGIFPAKRAQQALIGYITMTSAAT